jgi:hypothetical protein
MDNLEFSLYGMAWPERPVPVPPVSPSVSSAGGLMLDGFWVVVAVVAGIVLLLMLFGKKGAPVAVAAVGQTAAVGFSPWFPVR